VKLDHEFFFRNWRKEFGALNQSQVDGLNNLLERAERGDITNLDALAYVFATAHHETGERLQPVREGFATSNAGARQAVTNLFRRGVISWDYGKPNAAGLSFYGRGLAQITHEPNYKKCGKFLGFALEKNPDRALEPAVAVEILFQGMIRGTFTTRKLSTYFGPRTADFIGARAIINGIDRAKQIADIAEQYRAAFRPA
jgi:predicted chitinase